MAAPPPPPSKEGKKGSLTDADPEEIGATEGGEAEPLEIENGVEYEGEEVGPDQYRHYFLTVEGDEDKDSAVFTVDLTVQQGSANIFVNFPGKDTFPEKDEGKFDWNVKRGQLEGPPGTYNVSVYGVPSFIDKDVAGFLDGEDANWSSFTFSFTWRLLDADELAAKQSVADKFASRKESIFDSSFQDQMREKLEAERAELAAEEAEHEARLAEQEANFGKVDLTGTAVLEKYDLGERIAPGDFSHVYEGTVKSSGDKVAIKVFSKMLIGQMMINAAEATEYAKSAAAEDGQSGAVAVLDVMETDEALVVVMPRYERNMGDFLANADGYTEGDARKLVAALLDALVRVHGAGLAHRSIAPQHVLVGNDGGSVALTGWCLTDKIDEDEVAGTGGDPSYQAPEVMKSEPSGKAADVWSAGVLAFAALSGQLPFEDPNSMKLFSKITKGEFEFPAGVPEQAQDLVKSLLDVDASKRPTAVDALKHAWFASDSAEGLSNVAAAAKKTFS